MNFKKQLHTDIIGMIRTLIKEGATTIEASWVAEHYVNAGKSLSTAKHYSGTLCLSLGMKTKNKPTHHYIFDATTVLTNINAIIGVDTSVWISSKGNASSQQLELTTDRAKELLITGAETEIFELDNQMALIQEKRTKLLSKIEMLKEEW